MPTLYILAPTHSRFIQYCQHVGLIPMRTESIHGKTQVVGDAAYLNSDEMLHGLDKPRIIVLYGADFDTPIQKRLAFANTRNAVITYAHV